MAETAAKKGRWGGGGVGGGGRGCYGLNDGPLKYMDALRLLGDTVNIKLPNIFTYNYDIIGK